MTAEAMIIQLTRGQAAVIDDVDLPLVSGHSWSARCRQQKHGVCWYAATGMAGSLVYMHRLLLGLKPGDHGVDHKDGDGLNNRRSNLRLATASQNGANSPGQPSRRKSMYKGVAWAKDRRLRAGGHWCAQIKVNRATTYRYAKTEIEAAEIYNVLARQHFGQFARLNTLDNGNGSG